MRVALVYDRVNKFGGAERVLLALHEIWPEAPLFTSVYSPQGAPWAADFKVIPSFLNKFPLARSYHEFYPWLMPLVFESFDFDDFDVVISITSEFAKGIITKPSTLHLCYCLTPTRYLWGGYREYFRSTTSQFISLPAVSYLRSWDQIAGQRPDEYIAISESVRKRIEKYYRRRSIVIYPPVDTNFFKPIKKKKKEKYFLVVSRLVSYKRVDVAIKAFNKLRLPLKIIGEGMARPALEKIAKRNIEFLGQSLTDQEVLRYYQNCRALIFAGEEDLGLVSLEAQACGKPVICFKGGGMPETVLEGKTGLFFEKQTQDSLIESLKKFESLNFQTADCRRQAQAFDLKIFKRKFKELLKSKWQKQQRNFRLK
jgi:glycosyltransferase involved in cell wall biosynthesis